MNEKIRNNKAIAAVSIALLLVVLMVVGVFVFGQPTEPHIEITLPEHQDTPVSAEDDLFLAENSLLKVTPENAATALQSLKRPDFYHQSFSVVVGSGEAIKETTVELWVKGALIHAQVISDSETKVLISDGSILYLWYEADERPVKLQLDGDVTFEDVLGLPAFDYLKALQTQNITDAEYLVLEEETEVPCIFLSSKENDGSASRYWINLSTGLLYEADAVEGNAQIYLVKELSFDRLTSEDEAFSGKFMLPDGTGVFTEGTNMRQR